MKLSSILIVAAALVVQCHAFENHPKAVFTERRFPQVRFKRPALEFPENPSPRTRPRLEASTEPSATFSASLTEPSLQSPVMSHEGARARLSLERLTKERGWDLPINSREVIRLEHFDDGSIHLYNGNRITISPEGEMTTKYSNPSKAPNLPPDIEPSKVQSHTQYPEHTRTVERGGKVTYANNDGSIISNAEKYYLRDGKHEVNFETGDVIHTPYKGDAVAAARKFYDKNFERSDGHQDYISREESLPSGMRRVSYGTGKYSEKVDKRTRKIKKKMFKSTEIQNLLQKDPELHALISKFKTDISPTKPHLDLKDISQISQEGSKFKIKLKRDPHHVVRLDAATGIGRVSKIAYDNGNKMETTSTHIKESYINGGEKITHLIDKNLFLNDDALGNSITTERKAMRVEDALHTQIRNYERSNEALEKGMKARRMEARRLEDRWEEERLAAKQKKKRV